jgi:hypothetical protein
MHDFMVVEALEGPEQLDEERPYLFFWEQQMRNRLFLDFFI